MKQRRCILIETPEKAFLSYSGVQFSLHIIAKSQMFQMTHLRKRWYMCEFLFSLSFLYLWWYHQSWIHVMLLYFAELKQSFRDLFKLMDSLWCSCTGSRCSHAFCLYMCTCVCVGGVFKSIWCHLVIPIVDCCVFCVCVSGRVTVFPCVQIPGGLLFFYGGVRLSTRI